MLFALVVLKHGNALGDGVAAAGDGHESARKLRRHHDLVAYGTGLLNGADYVAAGESFADLGGGDELPLLLTVQCRNVGASGDGGACYRSDLRQRTLDTVVNILKHTGSELDGHRHTGRLDDGAGSETRSLLIDLDRRTVAVHVEDLADEPLRADSYDVGDVCVRKSPGDHKRAGYFSYGSAHINT